VLIIVARCGFQCRGVYCKGEKHVGLTSQRFWSGGALISSMTVRYIVIIFIWTGNKNQSNRQIMRKGNKSLEVRKVIRS
jgi:hypothetical protein